MTAPAFDHLVMIAGGGSLPVLIADAARKAPWKLSVIGFDQVTDPQALEGFDHQVIPVKRIGEVLDLLRQIGGDAVIMAGKLQRPSIPSLVTSLKAQKLLKRIGPGALGGDDALLRSIIRVFEEEGFRVVGIDAVLHGLLMPEGTLGKRRLDDASRADIEIGIRAAHALGALDIGQSIIVENGLVLGVEAVEGTDALIARCGPLKKEPRGGLLVKCRKPGQEERADLPTIGVQTLRNLRNAGFDGIAAEAGGCLLLDREETIAFANQHLMLLHGLASEAA